VEERQQGEGESASETSENGGVRAGGLLLNPHHFGLQDEDEVDSKEEGGEVTFRPAGEFCRSSWALLTNQYGLAMFRHFLKSEFSEENLDFWLAVERYKNTRPFSKMAARAETIYNEFISANGVNVDSFVRESTNQSLQFGVSPTSFQQAQDQIFTLMESDSYQRFLKSQHNVIKN
uniref:RGS domain-containing protein n=1 Tax=Nothobranchius furzeri TaxID=105023 RepID=A0A8C6PBL4_NOTFU